MKYPLHSATGPQPIKYLSICIVYSIHCIPLEADVVHKKLQPLSCIGVRRLRCVQEWERLRRSAKPKCKSIQSIGADFSEDFSLSWAIWVHCTFFLVLNLIWCPLSIDQGKVSLPMALFEMMDQPYLTWVISMKKWIPQIWWKLYQCTSWPAVW